MRLRIYFVTGGYTEVALEGEVLSQFTSSLAAAGVPYEKIKRIEIDSASCGSDIRSLQHSGHRFGS